jgi:hypothetical protein
MRLTGKRSNTRTRAALLGAAALCLFLPWARPVRALDVFTLWRQPELPLVLATGSWADYRTQVMAGGRREQGAMRVACVGRTEGGDAGWVVELLPLEEADDGSLHPLPGEGVRLVLSDAVAERTGNLLDRVLRVTRWAQGQPAEITSEQLREDPLVAASLETEFVPDRTEPKEDATRIISGQVLMCRQFVMSATDTQSVELPAGRLVQVTTREVTAAVHEDIPFLGLAYAAERIRAESTLNSPNSRFEPPPPQIRVEIMELVDFGIGATPHLGARD